MTAPAPGFLLSNRVALCRLFMFSEAKLIIRARMVDPCFTCGRYGGRWSSPPIQALLETGAVAATAAVRIRAYIYAFTDYDSKHANDENSDTRLEYYLDKVKIRNHAGKPQRSIRPSTQHLWLLRPTPCVRAGPAREEEITVEKTGWHLGIFYWFL